jgi:uncharacterized protein
MQDAANDAPIICSLDTSYIPRQTRFDPLPLLVAQPKQVLAHDPDPSSESALYGIRIAFPPQQN